MRDIRKDLIFSLIAGGLIALLFWWVSGAPFLHVFPGSLLLSAASVFALKTAYNWAVNSTALKWILILAFVLRLGSGIVTTALLPLVGYDEEVQKNGYLFRDAFTRDMHTWEIVQDKGSVWEVLRQDLFFDQYGGLSVLSALVYKYLSPAFHNKFLILFLSAFVSTLGIPFLWNALQSHEKLRLLAVLIYAFFPDAILFSASQMREPFILGLSAVLFWLVLNKDLPIKKLVVWAVIVGAALLAVSAKIALFILFLAAVWWLLENRQLLSDRISPKLFTGLIAIMVIAFGVLSLQWIFEAGRWDATLAVRNSGWIQALFSRIPEVLHLPFITIYGLFQPVLPAAIVEPSIPFWKSIGIFRALGWLVLSSFILYGFVYLAREKSGRRKWAVLFALMLFWLALSSFRAGGDLWDNPRYRLAILVPLAIYIARGMEFAFRSKDHWLWRIFAAQAVFNLFFLQWYISRYTNVMGKLDFPQMIAIICVLIGVIFLHGFFMERKKRAVRT